MSFIGSTSFGFAQNTIHNFQNTVLNSLWHCLRQIQQKLTTKIPMNSLRFSMKYAWKLFLETTKALLCTRKMLLSFSAFSNFVLQHGLKICIKFYVNERFKKSINKNIRLSHPSTATTV